MAKKAELLEQAHKLKLEVSNSNTIAEIEAAIKAAGADTEVAVDREAKTAKAGKRSEKALKESEAKQAKEERKADKSEVEEAPAKPKKAVKPARSRLERRSKGYRKVAELIDKDKEYELGEAIDLILKTSSVKFDASVELHVRLGVDPKQADQNIRNNVVLPAGTGKSVRVAVFGDEEDVKKAKAAGADLAMADEFLQQLDKGVTDFDVLIASPKSMAKLGKYAKVLGPKGLMPNPKSGTVAVNVAKAVKEAKAGKVEYRVDSTGIVHLAVGKASFTAEQLRQNLDVILSSIKTAKPASVKGPYVQSVYLTTTMGPSVKVVANL
jgi:large subunit ribosomal protein L1